MFLHLNILYNYTWDFVPRFSDFVNGNVTALTSDVLISQSGISRPAHVVAKYWNIFVSSMTMATFLQNSAEGIQMFLETSLGK